MIRVYPAETAPAVRALNGVNLGPVDRRWSLDLSEHYRAAAIPSVRTHDAPIQMNDVVDLHCVFPNPNADPEDETNYVFEPTDDYLAAVRATGAEIYFRFGESIEHQPTKRYVKANLWTPETMARVAVNVARHYNDGWANGHHWDIRYWEFWNEPELGYPQPGFVRPMWEGSVDEFYACYRAVATAMKAYDADLRVGLAGFTGGFVRPWLDADLGDETPADGWVGGFLQCVHAGVPIDFFSWHRYAAGWDEIATAAGGVRARLDALGLASAEQHLTEWAYNPTLSDDDGEFTFMQARRVASYERYEHAMRIGNGPAGAAFNFGTLAAMQDTSLDLAHHYTGVTQPFGLFQPSGRPQPKFAAFQAFGQFLRDDLQRVRADVGEGRSADLAVLAATAPDGGLHIGVASLDPSVSTVTLDVADAVPGRAVLSARIVTEQGWQPAKVSTRADGGALHIDLGEPTLCVLHLDRASTAG